MTWTHKRQPYYRPRSMGGDVAHPLCRAPITGWAGASEASKAMTDIDRHVDCPRCRHFMARGGITARLQDLTYLLDDDRPARSNRARRAAAMAVAAE